VQIETIRDGQVAALSARRPDGAHRNQPVGDRDARGRIGLDGITDPFNPSSAAKAIDDAVVKVVVKELEKEGIF